MPLSVSMVGRILAQLRATGQLNEPRAADFRPHSRHRRRYAIPRPKDSVVEQPGDLLPLDTMEIRPRVGMIRKHFTAVDLVSLAAVTDVHGTASALLAPAFLDQRASRFPRRVRAVQVDGGSAFMAEFAAACQERGITSSGT
jgi:hypothetical protein